MQHRKKLLAPFKAWRLRYPEKVKAAQRRWWRANRERVRVEGHKKRPGSWVENSVGSIRDGFQNRSRGSACQRSIEKGLPSRAEDGGISSLEVLESLGWTGPESGDGPNGLANKNRRSGARTLTGPRRIPAKNSLVIEDARRLVGNNLATVSAQISPL
jgi:hypothetical protein